MTEDQIARCWAFARGEFDPKAFEQWLFGQPDLAFEFSEEFWLELLSANYASREDVWTIRKKLAVAIDGARSCECPKIADLSAISMGGDWYFEKVFEPFETVLNYGPDKWWLYIARCEACGTHWLIAQDERIYDEWYLRRISAADVATALNGQWPRDFWLYEDVLWLGVVKSTPPRFLDAMSPALVETVADLLRDRPDIEIARIGQLLGISDRHAVRLIAEARKLPQP
jgi:hypothetical protein